MARSLMSSPRQLAYLLKNPLKSTEYMGASRVAAATALGSKSANPSHCQAVIPMPIGAAESHITSRIAAATQIPA